MRAICKHCGMPIKRWVGEHVWWHVRTGRVECPPLTVAEPNENGEHA